MTKVRRVFPAWRRSKLERLLDQEAISYGIKERHSWPSDIFIVEYEVEDSKAAALSNAISDLFKGPAEGVTT